MLFEEMDVFVSLYFSYLTLICFSQKFVKGEIVGYLYWLHYC